ncbi:MAG TPA: TonB-dependent receptor [Bacteroidales bacterium]|nr:TonB-dependent receptor [Bacteroidales bacterium]
MRYIILIVFTLTSLFVSGQVLTITDHNSGEPLRHATLMSTDPEVFATTNTRGQVNIKSFEGVGNIVIRMMGYQTLNISYREIKARNFSLQLKNTPITIDEVVVSATRWRQSSGDIPSKVSTIKPEQIALQNPQTAADLLNVSGKVFIQKSQQGGGSPMIRGFATNRLLYTIDGVRMNTAIFRGGNIQNVISLDPFATESTEVLFGPGSVIYGSDAIGGVMSFRTLTPQLSLKSNQPLVSGNAVFRHASANNEKTGHFDVNVGWKRWAMVTSYSSNDYGDLRMGSNGPGSYLKDYGVQRIDSTDRVVENKNPLIQTPSGFSQKNLMQKVRFRPNRSWDFQYAFHYSETSSYGRFDRHLRTRDGHPRYARWDYGPQIWMMNNFSASHTTKNALFDQLNIRMAQQYFEESRIDRDFNAIEQRNRIEKVDAWSVNVDFTKMLGSDNKINYGLEWVRNDVNSTAFNKNIISQTRTPIGTRYPQSDWSSYGAYADGHFKLSEKTKLHAGLRYNRYSINADFDTTFYAFPYTEANVKNGSVTGSLGLTHRPNESLVLKANLSTGFRSPNVDDIGKVFDSEPGAVVVPNPDLKAEYAYNADIGIAKIFGPNLKIDFTAFYTILDNAMVRRDFELNGRDSIIYDVVMSRVLAIQNAATATVYGVQFGLEAKLPQGFSFSSDFNYQHGEEELDDGTTSPSRHAAPWFGVSRLSYRADKLNMQLYSEYSGKVSYENLAVSEQGKSYLYVPDGEGNHYSPAWYTLNIKASYHMSDNWTISSGLENITDQRYRPYSSGISAPGRNFILSLKARF